MRQYGKLVMNIALRKLALLEKSLIEKDEFAKAHGLLSTPEDLILRKKISDFIQKAQLI